MRYILLISFTILFTSPIVYSQTENRSNVLFDLGTGVGIANWIAINNISNGNSTGNITTKFRGLGFYIPNFAQASYQLNKSKMGIGYGKEFILIKKLHNSNLPAVYFANTATTISKFYAFYERSILRKNNFTLGLTGRIGFYFLDKNHVKTILSNKYLVGIGIPLEFNKSNFLNVFIQPDFEYKYYGLPDLGIKNQIIAFSIKFGNRFYF